MLEDKEFLKSILNDDITTVLKGAEDLLNQNRPLPYIYNYILKYSKDRNGYITMLLFGMMYQRKYSKYQREEHLP